MVKKVWNIITWVLVGIVGLLAIFLFGFKLFGFQIYTVLSGSMEPTYLTGSVVYVQKVNTDDLKKGDVITYKVGSKTLVTHRIIELVPDPEDPERTLFRTKGDNNNTADGALVEPQNVVGRVAFGIPLLGYLSVFLQTPYGKIAAIAFAIMLLALMFLPDLLLKKDKQSEEDKQKTEEQKEEKTEG